MYDKMELREAWNRAWRWFDSALESCEPLDEENWDPWELAIAIDVPAFEIARLIPLVRKAGLVPGFDFEGRVHGGIARALAKLRDRGVEGAGEPLELEHGLTEAILLWNWGQMEAMREHPYDYFQRVRELRQRMPEIALCERTTFLFLKRVPPPFAGGGRDKELV